MSERRGNQPARSAGQKQPLSDRQRGLVIQIDRFLYWLSRHWLAVFNTAAAIYVGLPILAPVLMHYGAERPARAIYAGYSPMCHQMASRSFFLFGEQPAYPRAMAAGELTPIEQYMAQIPQFAGIASEDWQRFTVAARSFIGNQEMGYKMALCERDISIYGFVLLGGIAFAVLRRFTTVKGLPLLAFLVLGMGPIGLDGFSQLFGYMFSGSGATNFLSSIFPLRESTPLLRVLTGGWFGLSLVWLAYPQIGAGMRQTERELREKLGRIGAIKA
jgi:uncharacterized membrane protein